MPDASDLNKPLSVFLKEMEEAIEQSLDTATELGKSLLDSKIVMEGADRAFSALLLLRILKELGDTNSLLIDLHEYIRNH